MNEYYQFFNAGSLAAELGPIPRKIWAKIPFYNQIYLEECGWQARTIYNAETNDDIKADDDAETDDDTKTDDDAKTIENTDSDKIKSAISALDRPMRNTIARRASRKSLPYHTKQWDLVEMKLLISDKIILNL